MPLLAVIGMVVGRVVVEEAVVAAIVVVESEKVGVVE